MTNILRKIGNIMLGTSADASEMQEYEELDSEDGDDRDIDSERDKEKKMDNNNKWDNLYNSDRGSWHVTSGGYDSNIINLSTHTQMQVVITYPQEAHDGATICDYIKSNKIVAVNLEDTPHETAQRIADFLSGVAYALDGDIQCVSNRIFIIAPKNVDITGYFKEELKENGLLFSFAQSVGL